MIREFTMIMVGVFVISACATKQDSDEVAVTTEMETEETLDTAAAADLSTWEVALTASEGFDVMGEARVRALAGGRTQADVEISGAEPSAQHPWHIHSGKCDTNGPIVGSAAAYSTLTVNADGEATGSATIDVALEPDSDYYINIHKSPSETETIVACGPITRTQGSY